VIISSLSSATLYITLDGVQWIIFSKSTVAHTKMCHVSKTTPFLGVICHPFGKTAVQSYIRPHIFTVSGPRCLSLVTVPEIKIVHWLICHIADHGDI